METADMSNIALYQEMFRHFGAGDMAGVRKLIHPDIRMENMAPANSPISGDRVGIDAFIAYLDIAGENTASYEFLRAERYFESGEVVVALGREKFTIKSTGKTMETPFAHESHWCDGRLVLWREYYDSAKLQDAWTP